jgi:hypothetical protein
MSELIDRVDEEIEAAEGSKLWSAELLAMRRKKRNALVRDFNRLLRQDRAARVERSDTAADGIEQETK